MAYAIPVSDFSSNANEQIEHAAKAIGNSKARRSVFEAIYHHKAKLKTVDEIVRKTGLKRIRVLQEGRHLFRKDVIGQTKKNGEVAYEKIDKFHAHKKQILGFVANPKKLAKFPTKRKLVVAPQKSVVIPTASAKAIHITVDDVESFAGVRRIRRAGPFLASMTETAFKLGVQKIIGEPGKFKDWGGEKSDLYTTRLRFKGIRRLAAFAFKGRGEKGKLVPGRMGKNGDQALRLFQEPAEIFFVQHWREIDPSVIDLMQRLAIAKSALTGHRILFGIIDGNDSERLRLAYPSKFKTKPH